MEKPRLVHFANLDAIEIPHPDPKALTVICMHGYGADMRDLAPLAQELETKRPLRWLFPNAPEQLEWGGRAWFPIDVAVFEDVEHRLGAVFTDDADEADGCEERRGVGKIDGGSADDVVAFAVGGFDSVDADGAGDEERHGGVLRELSVGCWVDLD